MRKIFAIRKLHAAIEEGKSAFAEYSDLIEALETVNLCLHNVALDTVLYSKLPDKANNKTSAPRKKRQAEEAPRKPYVRIEPAILRPMLGTMPDQEIADSLGCSIGTVVRYRKKWGIPAYRNGKNNPYHWTPEHEAMLGCDTDDAIAKLLGRSKNAVTQRRYKLEIPSFSQGLTLLSDNAHLVESFNNAEIAELIGVPKKLVDKIHPRQKTIDDVLTVHN